MSFGIRGCTIGICSLLECSGSILSKAEADTPNATARRTLCWRGDTLDRVSIEHMFRLISRSLNSYLKLALRTNDLLSCMDVNTREFEPDVRGHAVDSGDRIDTCILCAEIIDLILKN